jgi:phospho-N-acetylmuramoyl-pentapeptide-transferase
MAASGLFETELLIPFINKSLNISLIPYSLLMILLLTAATNSMNITDGLDGLALGIAILVLGFIGAAAWMLGNTSILYSVSMLLGICFGTLVFNRHPAQIFMGDTGSLFLGGAIGLFLIELNIPVWAFLIMVVCLWETLSVIIQLTSLRLRGKRVFLIAPYHHHLEKLGWKETRIVGLFWLITLVFCLIGYLALNSPGALEALI